MILVNTFHSERLRAEYTQDKALYKCFVLILILDKSPRDKIALKSCKLLQVL